MGNDWQDCLQTPSALAHPPYTHCLFDIRYNTLPGWYQVQDSLFDIRHNTLPWWYQAQHTAFYISGTKNMCPHRQRNKIKEAMSSHLASCNTWWCFLHLVQLIITWKKSDSKLITEPTEHCGTLVLILSLISFDHLRKAAGLLGQNMFWEGLFLQNSGVLSRGWWHLSSVCLFWIIIIMVEETVVLIGVWWALVNRHDRELP